MPDTYQIRPISEQEWVPDRCLNMYEPAKPSALTPLSGCESLKKAYTKGKRDKLLGLFAKVISEYGCCGFVAWEDECIVAYNTFFPFEMASKIKFFGWGYQREHHEKTLVHACISLVNNHYYRRIGIGSSLIINSLNWAKNNGWENFVVNQVLPDRIEGYFNEQKSCVGFWEKFGFERTKMTNADRETKRIYNAEFRYSLSLDLNKW